MPAFPWTDFGFGLGQRAKTGRPKSETRECSLYCCFIPFMKIRTPNNY
jgi:hypothetical protein